MSKGTGRVTQIKRSGGKSGFYRTHSTIPQNLSPATPVPVQIVEEVEIQPVIQVEDVSTSTNTYVEQIIREPDIGEVLDSITGSDSTYIENIKQSDSIIDVGSVQSSDNTYKEFNPTISNIPTDLIQQSDNTYKEFTPSVSNIPSELSNSPNLYTENISKQNELSLDVQSSENTYKEFNPIVSNIPDNIQQSNNTYREKITNDSAINTEVQSSDNTYREKVISDNQINSNVQSSQDSYREINKTIPIINPDISTSPDTLRGLELIPSNIPSNIQQSSDTYKEVVKSNVNIDNNVGNSPDTYKEFNPTISNIPSELSTSPDTYKEFVPSQPIAPSTELADSKDTYVETIKPTQPLSPITQVLESPDSYHDFIVKPSNIPIEIIPSVDMYREIIRTKDSIYPSPDGIISTDDNVDKYLRREFMFSKGKWLPSGDPISIGADNFQTLQNYRYRDNGLESVGGWSRRNTYSAAQYFTNGIQLVTPYTQRSYCIFQLYDGGTNGAGTYKLIESRGTVPSTFSNFNGFYGYEVKSAVHDTFYFIVNSVVYSAKLDSGSTGTKYYSGTQLAAEIQSKVNGILVSIPPYTITSTITYSESARTFTFTISTGLWTYGYPYSAGMDGIIGLTSSPTPDASFTGSACSNGLPLYTESTASTTTKARFARLPGNNIGICDGSENLIYSGDEQPISAFLYGSEETFTTTAAMKTMTFTSNHGGPKTITLTEGTYTGDELAAEIQTQIRADGTTLILPSATVEFRFGRFYIDAGETGHTIKSTAAGNADLFLGFVADSGTAYKTLYSPSLWIITNGSGTGVSGKAPYFNSLLDGTKALSNTLTDNNNIVTIGPVHQYFLIGSSIPLSGFKAITTSGNFTASPLSGKYFDGEKWVALSSLSVSVSGTTNTVTFTDTSSVAKPLFINGYYLFFYRFETSTGDVTISNITLTSTISNMVDLWDGIYRSAIKFIYNGGSAALGTNTMKHDYTLEMIESTARTYLDTTNISKSGKLPVADVAYLATGESIEVLFSEPMCGFKWDVSTIETTAEPKLMNIYFWDGSQYVNSRLIYDTLRDSGVNGYFGYGSGIHYFNLPLYNTNGTSYTGVERISELENIKGYKYKITWTYPGGDSFAQLILDRFSGIPRYRTISKPYIFPFKYSNRSMLCGNIYEKLNNRVDYSAYNKPYSFNGTDASGFENERSLYFGDNTPLTGAIELFNQYGDNVESIGLFFKDSSTYMLSGDSPDNFKINTISNSIGCSAPYTITSAELALLNNQSSVNIAMWLSDVGPMMFIGNTIKPITGIECYFEPDKTATYINTTYFKYSRAWYDPNYFEWNIIIPTGASTVNNIWLVYDIRRDRWYERTSYSTTDFPQGGFTVEDSYGNKYVYVYSNDGYVCRMESGYTYPGGSNIVGVVRSSDILLTDSLWDRTMVRRVQTLFKTGSGGQLYMSHYGDGSTMETNSASIGTALTDISMPTSTYYESMDRSGYTTRNFIAYPTTSISGINNPGITSWSHSFKWSTTSVTTAKSLLIAWGVLYKVEREEILDAVHRN